jgi:hypothetical protein
VRLTVVFLSSVGMVVEHVIMSLDHRSSSPLFARQYGVI